MEVHSSPAAYQEKIVTIDVWGVNSHLTAYDVPLTFEVFEISTGKRVLAKDMSARLLPNQSTEVICGMDVTNFNPSDIVVSVSFKIQNGKLIRSSADWPQPLKYVDFSGRNVTYSVDREEIHLRAERPTKAVFLDLEAEDDSGLEWEDNGLDIMPGETVRIAAKGLNGRKITVNWYGKRL